MVVKGGQRTRRTKRAMLVRTEGDIQFQCWIPKDLHRRLKHASTDENIPMQLLLRNALATWLDGYSRYGGVGQPLGPQGTLRSVVQVPAERPDTDPLDNSRSRAEEFGEEVPD